MKQIKKYPVCCPSMCISVYFTCACPIALLWMSHCCYHLNLLIACQIMLVACQSDLLQHIVSKSPKKREKKRPTMLPNHRTTRLRRSICTEAKVTSIIVFQRRGKLVRLSPMSILSTKNKKLAFALKNISSIKRKRIQNLPSSSIDCKCISQIHCVYYNSADDSTCAQIIEVGYDVSAMMDDEGGAGKEEEENQGKENGHG